MTKQTGSAIRSFVAALLAAVVLAAAGVSAAKQVGMQLASGEAELIQDGGTGDGSGEGSDELTCPEDGSTDDGTSDDGTTDDGTSDDGATDDGASDDGSSEEEVFASALDGDDSGTGDGSETGGEQGCPSDDADADPKPEMSDDADPTVAREEACAAAAGVSPAGEEGDEAPGPAKGLDRALQVVGENCVKNPQAPGLLVALERLSANKAKQEERKAARQARREARAAERAAKRAAKAGGGEIGVPSALGGGQGGHGGKGKGKGRGKG